jgi:hypothetical protein
MTRFVRGGLRALSGPGEILYKTSIKSSLWLPVSSNKAFSQRIEYGQFATQKRARTNPHAPLLMPLASARLDEKRLTAGSEQRAVDWKGSRDLMVSTAFFVFTAFLLTAHCSLLTALYRFKLRLKKLCPACRVEVLRIVVGVRYPRIHACVKGRDQPLAAANAGCDVNERQPL